MRSAGRQLGAHGLGAGLEADGRAVDNRTLYFSPKQEVVTDRAPAPIGGSLVRRTGPAATVVTWGAITHRVLEAANRLAAQGVHVTVLETQWLDPFDHDAVHRSLPATGGKLAVVHEANLTGGFGGEVVARALDAGVLSGHPRRIATPDTRVPAAPELAAALIPGTDRIFTELRDLTASRPPRSPCSTHGVDHHLRRWLLWKVTYSRVQYSRASRVIS